MVVPSVGEGNTTMSKIDGNICKKRHGFTLVELVVVVLLMGILAGVAAPKMFDIATSARENTARQNLAVIRSAIELYYSQNDEFPGMSGNQAAFKSDLSQVLREPFPACAVGNKNNDVRIQSTGNPLSPTGLRGWAYDRVTGEFIINDSGYSSW